MLGLSHPSPTFPDGKLLPVLFLRRDWAWQAAWLYELCSGLASFALLRPNLLPALPPACTHRHWRLQQAPTSPKSERQKDKNTHVRKRKEKKPQAPSGFEGWRTEKPWAGTEQAERGSLAGSTAGSVSAPTTAGLWGHIPALSQQAGLLTNLWGYSQQAIAHLSLCKGWSSSPIPAV